MTWKVHSFIMKTLIIPLLILIALSCNKNKQNTLFRIKTWIDSTHIGINGKYKLLLQDIISNDSCYVKFVLFEKQNQIWIETQKYTFEKTALIAANPIFADFNHDGLTDMTIESKAAARGSNELRQLFIFEEKKKAFMCIKNAEDYANLAYNETLNCIDALWVYAGTSTLFLRIEKDSLKEFAEAEIEPSNDRLKVWTTDEKGVRKLIREVPIKDGEHCIRYKNFAPLTCGD